MTATGPARRYRIANAIFFFISGFGYAAWASRIPSIKENMNLSDSMLGAILFAMPIGLLTMLPLTNYLLRRFSSRTIMIVGSVTFNVMLCLAGFASTPWQLAILLFGFGSSRNLLNISMNTQAVSVQKLYSKSIITTFHGIWSIAGFAGAALGWLMIRSGIETQWHFLLIGCGMTLLTISQFSATLSEPPEQNHKTIFALPDKKLLHFSLIVFICMAAENTMYEWSGVFFQKTMSASTSFATVAFVAYMAAMTAGRFLGDRAVTRFGIKKVLFASALLLTSGFLTAVAFPIPIWGIVAFLMTGIGVSCIAPLVLSLAGKSTGRSSASTLASISSISYLGFLVVPPLIGFISESAGIRIAFGIVGLLSAAMLLMISRISTDAHKVIEHTEEIQV
jgi:fucose permease